MEFFVCFMDTKTFVVTEHTLILVVEWTEDRSSETYLWVKMFDKDIQFNDLKIIIVKCWKIDVKFIFQYLVH
jgi:hypothetical protein